MAKRSKIRSRRKRRQYKQGFRHGRSAKPTHKNKTGRTGQILEKKNRSKKKHDYVKRIVLAIPSGLKQINDLYKKSIALSR